MDEKNVYNSGLASDDWRALREVIWPFIHAEHPAQVEIPQGLPAHLSEHPLVALIRRYRATGDSTYLDQAGRLLAPTDEPFGWYLPLTK